MKWLRAKRRRQREGEGSRTSVTALTLGPTRKQFGWLAVAALSAMLLHAVHVPPDIALLGLALLAWRFLIDWQRIPPAGRFVRIALALVGLALVVAHFRNPFGRAPGIALLLLFLPLKLHELQRPRDAYAAILLSYFLLFAACLHTQSMLAGVALVAGFVLVTSALIVMHHPDAEWRATLRLGGVMSAQAIPFMLLFFVLFPRLPGPLWGIPTEAQMARSGLGETMEPGSISELVLSESVAFRVRFEDRVPLGRELYWRGPVLSRFDGRVWRAGESRRVLADSPYVPLGPPIRYEMTLEAHNKHGLFALEQPVAAIAGSVLTADFQLLSRLPVTQRQRYRLESHARVAWSTEDQRLIAEALALPAGRNPRTLTLGRELAAEARTPTAIVLAILTRFRREAYTYTLSPPLLGDQAVDEFLFETRRGFCEHFAAAFVTLARAAGLPARVVTGYQGGELNALDGYVTVRQSDAHAWAEVWIDGQGWQRVDPTAAIQPSRIESGLSAALPAGEPMPILWRPDMAWLRALRQVREAASNGWNQWVLGYNLQRQRELLQRIGLDANDWRQVAVVLATAAGLLMLVYALWATHRAWRTIDPLEREWARMGQKLAAHGLARAPWEGPFAWSERAGRDWPDIDTMLREAATHYAAARYAGADLRSATRAIRDLRRAMPPNMRRSSHVSDKP